MCFFFFFLVAYLDSPSFFSLRTSKSGRGSSAIFDRMCHDGTPSALQSRLEEKKKKKKENHVKGLRLRFFLFVCNTQVDRRNGSKSKDDLEER